MDVSEEIMQQAVAEAKAEVEQENKQNEIADAPQKPKRVNYQGMHYRAKDNPEAELKGVQARVMEKTMKKIANQFGLVCFDIYGFIVEMIPVEVYATSLEDVLCMYTW